MFDDPKNAREAVANGIDLLNHKLGRNWREEVYPPHLDMSDYCGCLLAHISHDRYTAGLIQLGIMSEDAWKYGFEKMEVDFEEEPPWGYEELQELWLKELHYVNETVSTS
jgi:hypothetical protein